MIMIKNKLIKVRKEKYTQENMAKILHMTQSQYQRREKGEIKISDEEWERMAKALDTTVEDIKEDDVPQSIINNYDNSSGSYYPHINNNYNIPEFLLKNMEEYIDHLKKQVEELKEEIKSLKS
ncbi:Helix-turn-helix [Chryseobacterium carnipullorum]|uniref:Helix-turn-helix n=2 Tax=Chryseobacterium carnipullorum TaxID=1124835 RepID=A0A376E6U8_CHRCU|nr:Helix-turn-helix [Chryseobacterium carnipullorum]